MARFRDALRYLFGDFSDVTGFLKGWGATYETSKEYGQANILRAYRRYLRTEQTQIRRDLQQGRRQDVFQTRRNDFLRQHARRLRHIRTMAYVNGELRDFNSNFLPGLRGDMGLEENYLFDDDFFIA